MTVSEALQKTWPAEAVEQGSDRPGSVLASALIRVKGDDLDGARADLSSWCETAPSRPGGSDDLISLAVLLLDQVADLMAIRRPGTLQDQAEGPEPRDARQFCPVQDEYSFTASTHLSLLTAAVLRQRAQIAQLLDLVETLSRRLA